MRARMWSLVFRSGAVVFALAAAAIWTMKPARTSASNAHAVSSAAQSADQESPRPSELIPPVLA